MSHVCWLEPESGCAALARRAALLASRVRGSGRAASGRPGRHFQQLLPDIHGSRARRAGGPHLHAATLAGGTVQHRRLCGPTVRLCRGDQRAALAPCHRRTGRGLVRLLTSRGGCRLSDHAAIRTYTALHLASCCSSKLMQAVTVRKMLGKRKTADIFCVPKQQPGV